MTDTAYLTLSAAAESLRKELVEQRDTNWHGKQSYYRLEYRINRLKRFETYCELAKVFN